jgi:hypothetical protein
LQLLHQLTAGGKAHSESDCSDSNNSVRYESKCHNEIMNISSDSILVDESMLSSEEIQPIIDELPSYGDRICRDECFVVDLIDCNEPDIPDDSKMAPTVAMPTNNNISEESFEPTDTAITNENLRVDLLFSKYSNRAQEAALIALECQPRFSLCSAEDDEEFALPTPFLSTPKHSPPHSPLPCRRHTLQMKVANEKNCFEEFIPQSGTTISSRKSTSSPKSTAKESFGGWMDLDKFRLSIDSNLGGRRGKEVSLFDDDAILRDMLATNTEQVNFTVSNSVGVDAEDTELSSRTAQESPSDRNSEVLEVRENDGSLQDVETDSEDGFVNYRRGGRKLLSRNSSDSTLQKQIECNQRPSLRLDLQSMSASNDEALNHINQILSRPNSVFSLFQVSPKSSARETALPSTG